MRVVVLLAALSGRSAAIIIRAGSSRQHFGKQPRNFEEVEWGMMWDFRLSNFEDVGMKFRRRDLCISLWRLVLPIHVARITTSENTKGIIDTT